MNYYDVLGIDTDASASEIGSKYRALKALYEGDLATYGLLSDGDREAARNAVEQAYFVLCDTVKRKAYDRELAATGHAGPWLEIAIAPAPESQPEPEDQELSLVPPSVEPQSQAIAQPVAADIAEKPVPADSKRQQPTLKLMPPDDRLDGSYLRALREMRGVSLESVSQALKITQTQIDCIETHKFDRLPAPVYLRGFLRNYARHLSIDGDRLVKDYMDLRDAWERQS